MGALSLGAVFLERVPLGLCRTQQMIIRIEWRHCPGASIRLFVQPAFSRHRNKLTFVYLLAPVGNLITGKNVIYTNKGLLKKKLFLCTLVGVKCQGFLFLPVCAPGAPALAPQV